MQLHHESTTRRRPSPALAFRLLTPAGVAQPHVEDAFLADFARFACDAGGDVRALRLAIEAGRAALDLVEDTDGPWQALPIEAWLEALSSSVAHAGDRDRVHSVARAFVEWLVTRGQLSLHGQRVLARRIGTWRSRAVH
jgi:hypothetical protein